MEVTQEKIQARGQVYNGSIPIPALWHRCNGKSQVTGIEILLLSGMSVTSGQRYRGKF
jgi:hypothetical protein